MVAAELSVKRILIIEDHTLARDALGLVLEDEGYQVSVAGNGQEALDYLRTHEHPCVILLDLMMPVMSGWQFRAEQERDAELAHIPVVVITAIGEVAPKHRLGITAWLTKPFPLDELLATLARYC